MCHLFSWDISFQGKPLQRLQQTYVHRGDRIRRNERIKKLLLVAGLAISVALIPREQPQTAEASSFTHLSFGSFGQSRSLRDQLDATRGELELTRARLERANAILSYSSKYKIDAQLASQIYDIAQAEGIDADLGFRIVSVESEFNPHATSSVGAIGLTQLMPATARFFDHDITRDALYQPETNLRLGFRYLRSLITEYNGNLSLALLVYNRGPQTIQTLQSLGVDPANGYDALVMKGYSGTGLVN